MAERSRLHVQLHVEASTAPECFRGRVEHVASGQATHFATLAEYLTFIARVLRQRRAHPPCNRRDVSVGADDALA